MIPRAHIIGWRTSAPWLSDAQVEQDLIICRALVLLFSHEQLKNSLGFRGGAALHKLYLKPASRYSEDIDLVQTHAMSAKPLIVAVQESLDPLLGKPQIKQTRQSVVLMYRTKSEGEPIEALRLKIEVNTREISRIFNHHNQGQPPGGNSMLVNYAQRKWKFILAMSILIVLNYFAWSFLWEDPSDETEQDEQADLHPTNIA